MGSNTRPPATPLQGLYETSAAQMNPLGTRLCLNDGREFVYATAGAVALVHGRLMQGPLTIAEHAGTGQAVDAPAAGTNQIAVTPGAVGGAENLYAEGYLVFVNDTDDPPDQSGVYKVSGHAAITASTAFTVTIYDQFWEAVDAAQTVAMVHHPCKNILVKPASPATASLVGVAIRSLAISASGWIQTRGVAGVLQDGAFVNGSEVVCSDGVAGAMAPQVATSVADEPTMGVCISNTATGDLGVVFLSGVL